MTKRKKSDIPKVFISSTVSDLGDYRQAAKNAAVKAAFLPVLSEDFSAVEAPPLDHCLERVEGCDLLVVLVAHRYGWVPAGQRTKVKKSITWLECEAARKKGLDVLAFILPDDAPWPAERCEGHRLAVAAQRGEATAELMEEVNRAGAGLTAFKRWLRRDRIVSGLRSPDELGHELAAALHEWSRRRSSGGGADPIPRSGEVPRGWVRAVFELTHFIDIRGLRVGSGEAHRFPIEDLYIPLTRTGGGERVGMEGGPALVHEPVELTTALSRPRLVVVGDPGAGKTTFLSRIAHTLAEAAIDENPALARTRLGLDETPWPLLLRLSDLGDFIRRERRAGEGAPTSAASPEWLVRFFVRQAAEMGVELEPEAVRAALRSGEAMLLLDGLDEAPSRREREALTKLIAGAARTYSACRMVVTTRPRAYVDDVVLEGFDTARIAPLEDETIATFLRHWCAALFVDQPARAETHRAELEHALRARPDIRRMATNPVMLTALAVVHWNDKRLPEERHELFESIMTWLSRSREERPGRPSADLCLEILQELALAMQRAKGGRKVQVSRRWAAERVKDRVPEGEGATQPVVRAETFLREEELDSGILVSRGHELRFWHLTFQEYLAARGLASRVDDDQRRILFDEDPARLHAPEWRETVLLFLGILRQQGPDRVDAMVATILQTVAADGPPAEVARVVGLIGAVERDLRRSGWRVRDEAYAAMLERVMAVFDPEASAGLPVEVRIEAADALGRAGDPRLREDGWVAIERGSFLMGAQADEPDAPGHDPDAKDWEGPPHEVELDAFEIARYPVTVGEFAVFMEDEGYRQERHWAAGGFGDTTEPEDWSDQRACPTRPVVGVSWYEASAYCSWRGVVLPTEAQWEYAARGEQGRRYPWGPEKPSPELLNFDSNVGHPTPVGIYPRGVTPEGVLDMAGNVIEWCRDAFEYPYSSVARPGDGLRQVEDAAARDRVLRGGAFDYDARFVRCSDRGGFEPDGRDRSVGFRVARVTTS